MIQIQLQPEVEAQLAAEAQAYGVALDDYVASIVRARPVEPSRQQRTVSEAIKNLRELRKGSNLGEIKIKDLVNEGHKY